MELRHLRYFRAVATLLNYSRAAEQLQVGQPTLSRQVKDLEDEIGVQLLERNRAHVKLTDAGRLFLAQVDKLLAQVEIAVETARDTRSGADGKLIICTEWRVPIAPLPQAIAEFRHQFPRVEIELCEAPMIEHLTKVRSGKAHIGFAPKETVTGQPPLTYMQLLTSDTIVAVGASHPLANRKRVRLAEFKHDSWIVADSDKSNKGYHLYVGQECRRAGFVPNYGKTARTLEGMIGLVASGIGVALLPAIVMRRTLPTSVRMISSDCDPTEIGAIWDPANESALLRNFVAILSRLAEGKA